MFSIFGLQITYNISTIYAQSYSQNKSSVLYFTKDKIILNVVTDKTTTIAIKFHELDTFYEDDIPYFDTNIDPNTIIIQDPNKSCCINRKLTKTLLFPILKLPPILFDHTKYTLTDIPLAFSFKPPLDINTAYLRYYTCQYDDYEERLIWDNICDDDNSPYVDDGKIIIYLSDYCETDSWDNNNIKPGKGDQNIDQEIIDHTGAFILLVEGSEGRCFLKSL